MHIYIHIYIYTYIERPSADAADTNPEHVTSPRSTPGDVGAVPETNDVINQLSRHTLSGQLGDPWVTHSPTLLIACSLTRSLALSLALLSNRFAFETLRF